MDNIFAVIAIFVFIGVPLILTITNIVYCFKKPRAQDIFFLEGNILFFGFVYSLILFALNDFKEWDMPLILDNQFDVKLHTPHFF